MKTRAIILSALLVAAAVVIAAWLVIFRSEPRPSGPLPHEAYVWQRAWTQPVREAVAQHTKDFQRLVLLNAEISWKEREPQIVRVPLPYATLRAAGAPVGLALRIGPYSGPFAALKEETHPRPLQGGDSARSNVVPLLGGVRGGSLRTPQGSNSGDAITLFLCDLAASLIAQAHTNQISVSELQIDFDCAKSKLDGYRFWLEAIQRRVAPTPVTITALPSWLDASAFKRLTTTATNYVLQVHSLERPTDSNAPFTLCDPRAAQRAVERAGRIGVPFRVALPTYGYLLAFDRAGKFIGLSAEGPRKTWPDGAQLREVNSNPMELSALVRNWTAHRPQAMTGVIWYRLPVAVDNFNWRWPTLGAIVASRVPREVLRVSARRVETGLVEISLANEGDLDTSSRLAVEVRWSDARLVAGDGLRDFELVDRSLSTARFQTKSNSFRLPAGDFLTLGWLRFDRDCEVQCELKKL